MWKAFKWQHLIVGIIPQHCLKQRPAEATGGTAVKQLRQSQRQTDRQTERERGAKATMQHDPDLVQVKGWVTMIGLRAA